MDTKGKMMGHRMSVFRRRFYCCPGHDGLNKAYIKKHRTALRKKEERQWMSDID